MTAMIKLDRTNYQKWKKTLVMNLTFMKLDLALEIDLREKPTDDNSASVKKLYEHWKHFNDCCMMMMENCMDEAVYARISKMDTTKGLLEERRKKFIKFDMNKKHHYLDLLNDTNYDEVRGVMNHIMLLSSYYNKSKGPKDDTHHMEERKEYFNGRCSYYKKVGHKKVDCWKLKEKKEKKGDDKSKGTNQS